MGQVKQYAREYKEEALKLVEEKDCKISMDTNMKTELCVETVKNAVKSYPELKGAILHSDRGSRYTSEKYREALKHSGLVQSMNSADGRCHDNARCESMWARMKEELFYSRNRKSENYTVAQLKTMIWRYYMSYWNAYNHRVSTVRNADFTLLKANEHHICMWCSCFFLMNIVYYV